MRLNFRDSEALVAERAIVSSPRLVPRIPIPDTRDVLVWSDIYLNVLNLTFFHS